MDFSKESSGKYSFTMRTFDFNQPVGGIYFFRGAKRPSTPGIWTDGVTGFPHDSKIRFDRKARHGDSANSVPAGFVFGHEPIIELIVAINNL